MHMDAMRIPCMYIDAGFGHSCDVRAVQRGARSATIMHHYMLWHAIVHHYMLWHAIHHYVAHHHRISQAIQLGDADVVVAGGQESMSTAPHALPKSRTGKRSDMNGLGVYR